MNQQLILCLHICMKAVIGYLLSIGFWTSLTLSARRMMFVSRTPITHASEGLDNKFESQMSHYKDQIEQKRRIRDRQSTIMTVTMTLAFLIFNLPVFIYIFMFHNVDPNSSSQTQTWFGWCLTVIQISGTLNCTINFFMYSLSGSKFRLRFKKLILLSHEKEYLKCW